MMSLVYTVKKRKWECKGCPILVQVNVLTSGFLFVLRMVCKLNKTYWKEKLTTRKKVKTKYMINSDINLDIMSDLSSC